MGLKRIVWIVGAITLVLLLMSGGLWSYLRTAGERVMEAAQEAVPIEFDIERARGMVRDLVPEIRKNMQIIAREEVEVERLAEQLAEAERNMAADKQVILQLKGDLEQGKLHYVYGGQEYSQMEVRNDLATKFARYRSAEANYQSLCAIKEARIQSLDAAREKLEEMLAVKRQLEVDVEQLEARLRMLEVAQTTSKFQFDESRLGQAKELVEQIRTRLAVAERVLNSEVAYAGEIELEEQPSEDIVEEVAEYFGDQDFSLAGMPEDPNE